MIHTQKTPLSLILASTSPARRELLSRFQLTFSVEAPNIDESARVSESAQALATRLAREKALAVSARHHNALVIGSDQVATDASGCLIGKPGSKDAAKQQLAALSGQAIHFYTAAAVINSPHDIVGECLVRYDVVFRQLSALEIDTYVELDSPEHCAGSFKAESLGIVLFEKMSGDDFTALIGLPLIQLSRILRLTGLDRLHQPQTS